MRLMADNQFDTIYHEHFSYFSLLTVEQVFREAWPDVVRRRGAPDARRVAENDTRVMRRTARSASSPALGGAGARAGGGFGRLEHYLSFGEQVKEHQLALLRLHADPPRERAAPWSVRARERQHPAQLL